MNTKKFIFNESWDVKVIPLIGIVVLNEYRTDFLVGPVYDILMKAMDGRVIDHDLAVSLSSGAVQTAEIIYTLKALENKNYIREGVDLMSSREESFFDQLNIEKVDMQTSSVHLINLSKLNNTEINSRLESAPFKFVDSLRKADYVVVLVDDYLQSEISELAQEFRQQKIPWLLCKPIGQQVWLGPLIGGPKDSCYICLKNRLDSNERLSVFLEECETDSEIRRSRVYSSVSLDIAFGLVWNALTVFLGNTVNSPLDDQLITYKYDELSISHHPFTKRPQCWHCGDKHKQEPLKKLEFTPAHETFSDRLSDSSALWDSLSKHISPITGIIKKVGKNSQGWLGPVYLSAAEHVFLHKPGDASSFFKALYMSSGGKGKNKKNSDLAAACESLERYSGIFQAYEPTVLATMNSLQEKVIPPESCALWSQNQYDNREVLNRQHDQFQRIPSPLPRDLEIQWSAVYSLKSGEEKYLPSAYCYYGGGDRKDWNYFYSDSNGVAAGSDCVEAAYHGLLELFERDAVAIWWYNKIQRPAVDLASFGDEFIDQVQNYFTSLGRDLWVLDISNDMHIPVFVAISACKNRERNDIVYGFGGHLNAINGITSALMELIQTLPCVLDRNTDGTTRYLPINRDCMIWWEETSVDTEKYLLPLAGQIKTAQDYKKPRLSMKQGMQTMISTLINKGYEPYILDQTRPDIGLSVCKVIVPGLRHFWMRFADGRLYDFPVALGWLDNKKTESELNRFPIFF